MQRVTLPMYDFPEVRMYTNELVSLIVAGLNRAGWAVMGDRRSFANHAALLQHWRSPSTALSQSCGLPFVEDLADVVDVVGTFQWRNVSDEHGNYRSRIVVREGGPQTLGDLCGTRPVVNNHESLSGWWSLGATLHEHGYSASDFQSMQRSGAHASSLLSIQENRADVAAIDAASFALLAKHRPASAVGLRSIGEAPEIPATPIVAPKGSPLEIAKIQEVVSDAVRQCSRQTREGLGITAFVSRTNTDYEHLRARPADTVLPRNVYLAEASE